MQQSFLAHYFMIRWRKTLTKTLSWETFVHALVLSRLDLLQLSTGQLARSDPCTTYSCPALRCEVYSETGFCIVGYDGAPLAPIPSSNNIQTVYIDAWHQPWSLLEIHEGDGGSRVHFAGSRAPSICHDAELVQRRSYRCRKCRSYDICRTKLKFGERAFAVATQKAWNSLMDFLIQTNDVATFRKDLKTHLVNLAYN